MVITRGRVQGRRNELSSRKIGKKWSLPVIRRSDRIRNLPMPIDLRHKALVVQHITLSTSEEDDEPVDKGMISKSRLVDEDLVEKADAVVERLKIKSPKGSCSVDLKYRRLYFDSQIKVEKLTKENEELRKEVLVARGKIKGVEVLGKENEELRKEVLVARGKIEGLVESGRVCTDLLGKFQSMPVVLYMGKGMESTLNPSPQEIVCGCSGGKAVVAAEVAVSRRGKGKKK